MACLMRGRPARGKSTPVCESFASDPQNARHPTDVVDAHVSLPHSTATDTSGVPTSGLQRGGPHLSSTHRARAPRGPQYSLGSGRWGSGGLNVQASPELRSVEPGGR
jgi:hypothetical protein